MLEPLQPLIPAVREAHPTMLPAEMSAEEYLQWAAMTEQLPPTSGAPRQRISQQQVYPFLEALSCCMGRDTMQHHVTPGGAYEHTARPMNTVERPWRPGETIYDRADACEQVAADVVIHDLRNLPQRCQIGPDHAGPNIALQERIRIQAQDDYPTIERHLARETPIHWAWETGYASTGLVPYEGPHFRSPAALSRDDRTG